MQDFTVKMSLAPNSREQRKISKGSRVGEKVRKRREIEPQTGDITHEIQLISVYSQENDINVIKHSN